MSDEVTQSLRIVTSEAWTVTEPEMFLPSTPAPSLVTVTDPDGASAEQLAPVLVAWGKPHALRVGHVPRPHRRVQGRRLARVEERRDQREHFAGPPCHAD